MSQDKKINVKQNHPNRRKGVSEKNQALYKNKRSAKQPAPIRMWLTEPLEKEVSSVLQRLRFLRDLQKMAVMPDVHLAKGVCIGTVLATERLLYPTAVGGDIGCGMATVRLQGVEGELGAQEAYAMFEKLETLIPILHHPKSSMDTVNSSFQKCRNLSHPRLQKKAESIAMQQLGTLGRGNHFLELQRDEEGAYWWMVHSGSRGMGQAIKAFHEKEANESHFGLPFLDAETDAGKAYLHDMEWAREYASLNRRRMLEAALEVSRSVLGGQADWTMYIHGDHNHVCMEVHEEQRYWVYRKEASRTRVGEAALIPGSMGRESFHVTGRGEVDALCSSSHGAGRSMHRTDARRQISRSLLQREMQGVWFREERAHSLREEAPSAYKDIRKVMRAQRELVRIDRIVRPCLSYKGS